MFSTSAFSRIPVRQTAALCTVLVLWIGYTVMQTLFVIGNVAEGLYALLGFIPGIAGIAALLFAGKSRSQLFLRHAGLSGKGFAVLAAIFVFALLAIVPFGEWQGWSWMTALLYAPASGISQELFFRAALLPACLILLRGRERFAILLQAFLFSLWHIGPFFVGAPLWAGLAVLLVPFLSGIGWGWQVSRDRTVVWAAIQHSLIWVIAGQFPLPQ